MGKTHSVQAKSLESILRWNKGDDKLYMLGTILKCPSAKLARSKVDEDVEILCREIHLKIADIHFYEAADRTQPSNDDGWQPSNGGDGTSNVMQTSNGVDGSSIVMQPSNGGDGSSNVMQPSNGGDGITPNDTQPSVNIDGSVTTDATICANDAAVVGCESPMNVLNSDAKDGIVNDRVDPYNMIKPSSGDGSNEDKDKGGTRISK
jgi:hypothetical protein